MRARILACAALLLVWSASAHAQWLEFDWVDPHAKWRTLETEHFAVHFPERRRPQARVVAAIAEKVYPRITTALSWEPKLRTHMMLLDSSDLANGFASPLPFNYTGIFLTPPDDGELLQNRDWLELVITHEFFHIVHLDKARGAPLGLRSVFGRIPFAFPNIWQPGWILEGLAVYTESEASRGWGRLENTHFDGMMRAEVERGLRGIREVNAEGRGFPLNRDYLYGSYFFAFLREQYGEAAVRDFIDNYSGIFWPILRVDSNPVLATGKTMSELWIDYHEWLRQRFAPKPGAGPPAEGELLVRAWSISSPVLGAGGERWWVQADGYTRPRLMRQARGAATKELREVDLEARLAAGPGDSVLLAQIDICDNHYLLYEVYRVDAKGSRRRLTDCSRDRLVADAGDGRVAAARLAGSTTEVVLIDTRGKVERTLYQTAVGESVSGIAAKGNSVVITALRNGRWSLLELGEGKVSVLLSDAAIKHSPRFGGTADEIFFVADYGKTYNVWSLRRDSRSLARWTQARNGIREASAPAGGELLLTTIEPEGDALRLYRLPDTPFERKDAPPVAELPAAADQAELALPDRAYSPWSSLRPTSWFPLITSAEGTFGIGFEIYGQDALGLHWYDFAPIYEVTQRQMLGFAQYVYDNRHGITLDRSMTVKGNNGNTEQFTIKEHAQWVSLGRHLRLNQRFYWGIGAALDKEQLHIIDQPTQPIRNEKVVGLVAGVDGRRLQWLSEGPSQGQQLRLFVETSSRLHGDYTGNFYRGDWRGNLPLGKTVLSGRWNETYSQPGAKPVELGGIRFTDEYFVLPVLNQREFGLRGYTNGEPTLTGHRSRIVSTEWRTPLTDVDRQFMAPPVGLNRLSLSVFFEAGAAWERRQSSPGYHRSVGIEFLAEPRLLYLLGGLIRFGIAHGFDEGGHTYGYLTAGRSF